MANGTTSLVQGQACTQPRAQQAEARKVRQHASDMQCKDRSRCHQWDRRSWNMWLETGLLSPINQCVMARAWMAPLGAPWHSDLASVFICLVLIRLPQRTQPKLAPASTKISSCVEAGGFSTVSSRVAACQALHSCTALLQRAW
eukprot:6490970-Amphidinium_carterae.2